MIRGEGSITWISNKDGPHIPVVGDDIPCPTFRDVVVSRVGAVRSLKTIAPLSGVLDDVRQPCSDSGGVGRRCVISGGSGPDEQACCVLCAAG